VKKNRRNEEGCKEKKGGDTGEEGNENRRGRHEKKVEAQEEAVDMKKVSE
jgi:hypothetical protein